MPGRPFLPGNPGRPKGSKTRVTTARIKAAQALFNDLALDVVKRIGRHFKMHPNSPSICGTCPRYAVIVLEYRFGKPSQHVIFTKEQEDWAIKRMAQELGTTEEEVRRVAEEERTRFRLVRSG